MNEKVKNFIKIFCIWYTVSLIIIVIYSLFNEWQFNFPNIKDIGFCLLFPLIIPILTLFIFSPAFLSLYFFFKKYKSIKARMFLTAMMFPLTNAIYFIIEHYTGRESIELTSMIIGFYALFCVLPLLFISIICIPKSLIQNKKEALLTTVIMWITGSILIFLSNIFLVICDNFLDKIELKKYDKIIEKIEAYKTENGVYPDKIEQEYNNLYYSPENDKQDYIVSVQIKRVGNTNYNKCSDSKIKGCYEGNYDFSSHKKFGKWIKTIDLD